MIKTLDNAEMLRVELRRGAHGEDDLDVKDIAVERPSTWDDDDFDQWRSEVLTSINNQYNHYGYWSEVIISWLFIDDNEAIYIELGRL